jgi:hypothetical protein
VQHFPLRVNNYGRELDIGTLAVVASFRRVYRDLLNRGLTILISQGVKTSRCASASRPWA